MLLLAGNISYQDNPLSRPNFDVFSLNIKTLEMNRLKIKGSRLTPRRLTAAFTDGVKITVLGGVDENYQTMSDINIFSLSSFL